jgi:hypothetical protein
MMPAGPWLLRQCRRGRGRISARPSGEFSQPLWKCRRNPTERHTHVCSCNPCRRSCSTAWRTVSRARRRGRHAAGRDCSRRLRRDHHGRCRRLRRRRCRQALARLASIAAPRLQAGIGNKSRTRPCICRSARGNCLADAGTADHRRLWRACLGLTAVKRPNPDTGLGRFAFPGMHPDREPTAHGERHTSMTLAHVVFAVVEIPVIEVLT